MKKNNKGFTLVELIVVLVILAILAAILVPALLGYIDNARNKQIVLNARSAMIAAQAEMSSIYGSKEAKPTAIEDKKHCENIESTADKPSLKWTTLKVGAKEYDDSKTKKEQHDAYTITYVEYTDATGTVYFDGTDWIDTAPATTGLKVYTIQVPTT